MLELYHNNVSVWRACVDGSTVNYVPLRRPRRAIISNILSSAGNAD
jgi:hypothetical protein